MTIPLSGLVLAMLCLAAIEDLLYRKIDNWLVAILFMLWPVSLWLGVLEGQTELAGALRYAASALPGAAAVLVGGFVLFRLNQVGAGDVKLMAVLCLWVGAQQQSAFLIVTSLAGGFLVLAMPQLVLLEKYAAGIWWSATRCIPGLRGIAPPHSFSTAPVPGVPYALAITAGAAFILPLPSHS